MKKILNVFIVSLCTLMSLSSAKNEKQIEQCNYVKQETVKIESVDNGIFKGYLLCDTFVADNGKEYIVIDPPDYETDEPIRMIATIKNGEIVGLEEIY